MRATNNGITDNTEALQEIINEMSVNLNKLLSTDLSEIKMLGNDMKISTGTINADEIE